MSSQPTDVQVRFRQALDRPSDIVDHLPALFAAALGASVVIELGARSGVSSCAFLTAIEPGDGRLYSVDIDPQPFTHPQWTFIQGDDTDPAVFDQLPECDVLFIDTSHHFEHTLAELNLYVPTVRSGGVVLLHDTELERPYQVPATDPPFPVAAALDEFCALSVGRGDLTWSNTSGCWGLGRIDIP